MEKLQVSLPFIHEHESHAMRAAPLRLLTLILHGTSGGSMESYGEGLSCISHPVSDVCVIIANARLDPSSSTIYLPTTRRLNRTVKPYAGKLAENAMATVTPILVRGSQSDEAKSCSVHHNVPAVVFSTAGFTSNLFHDFNDVIVPLFITTRHFESRVQLVVTDLKPWWVKKYKPILNHLSTYPVIDHKQDSRIHCFPGMVLGLKYHKDMGTYPSETPNGYTMSDFKNFVMQAFSLDHGQVPPVLEVLKRPTLLLISRRKTRVFLNEEEMIQMMREVGFEVAVVSAHRMADLQRFAPMVASCNVLLGAHGAGLANFLFLSPGAVLLQVVPLGLDWASTNYYAEPAGAMGMRYLEYHIVPEESSLYHKYPPDHPVLTNPMVIHMQGYNVSRAVYVDGQNLRLDLKRFRETLVQAMQLIMPTP
ncbi:hypothetical protein AMTR_s00007p00251750 [Amborella trichopoda]|uniref:Glycosyltransferase 61 catalytic domain-containing protein n=1 Tax=Amborella trichopoda TaxID=13333 RepID=W1PCW6_AMBTC|nr:hypothetical protein AMTR_s00007p00251750 [Amborella trichopoda]